MKTELFPFQKRACFELREKSHLANDCYCRTHTPQVISFTAPTGAGKTIMMASLIESILFGDENYHDEPNSIFVWLSDSPQLNEQSKQKIGSKADRIRFGQCVTITEDSFDQEILEDGNIYFLNTQKLGKSSNLTKNSDTRAHTIWETLANTAEEKGDHLYIIIDEAHRGMQGREAGKATSIMQKFLKGSPDDGLKPMPVVLGMSATSARFDALVANITSTTHKVVITPDEVRQSGLLKDRIILNYPENEQNSDMAILQAAADEWWDKWNHWGNLCDKQHHAYVNPVFVIQVLNGTGDSISQTNLSDCIDKIEERLGKRFEEGEIVHAFGQTTSTLDLNGRKIPYVEPSSIADNRDIKIVFFKESLSTGWDCPRAETMMSFRAAKDATYIAQLLGRMIRTPLQQRITVDETLNDVHLFLPHFNMLTVNEVISALKDAEGGDLPTYVGGESIEKPTTVLTVNPTGKPRPVCMPATITTKPRGNNPNHGPNQPDLPVQPDLPTQPTIDTGGSSGIDNPTPTTPSNPRFGEYPPTAPGIVSPAIVQEPARPIIFKFNREEVMKAINDAGLLSYKVDCYRVEEAKKSLFAFSRLVSQAGLDTSCTSRINKEIVEKIRIYKDELDRRNEYETMTQKLMEFKLLSTTIDVISKDEERNVTNWYMSTTELDIERQFKHAEVLLGSNGIGNLYGKLYYKEEEPYSFMIDVILYAGCEECMKSLNLYAEKTFHELIDKYRRDIAKLPDTFKDQYYKIVTRGNKISKLNFTLPESIIYPDEPDGKNYDDHLFVDDLGNVKIKLNGWEEGVLKEEQSQKDYVCWLRNIPRKPWALCIPYEMGGQTEGAYPDFLVIRKDKNNSYIVDILEPHDPSRKDNLPKAKGFAKYANENPELGRIELIRMSKDAIGNSRFKRLDMAKSEINQLVLKAMTNDDLDHIFDEKGSLL